MSRAATTNKRERFKAVRMSSCSVPWSCRQDSSKGGSILTTPTGMSNHPLRGADEPFPSPSQPCTCQLLLDSPGRGRRAGRSIREAMIPVLLRELLATFRMSEGISAKRSRRMKISKDICKNKGTQQFLFFSLTFCSNEFWI